MTCYSAPFVFGLRSEPLSELEPELPPSPPLSPPRFLSGQQPLLDSKFQIHASPRTRSGLQGRDSSKLHRIGPSAPMPKLVPDLNNNYQFGASASSTRASRASRMTSPRVNSERASLPSPPASHHGTIYSGATQTPRLFPIDASDEKHQQLQARAECLQSSLIDVKKVSAKTAMQLQITEAQLYKLELDNKELSDNWHASRQQLMRERWDKFKDHEEGRVELQELRQKVKTEEKSRSHWQANHLNTELGTETCREDLQAQLRVARIANESARSEWTSAESEAVRLTLTLYQREEDVLKKDADLVTQGVQLQNVHVEVGEMTQALRKADKKHRGDARKLRDNLNLAEEAFDFVQKACDQFKHRWIESEAANTILIEDASRLRGSHNRVELDAEVLRTDLQLELRAALDEKNTLREYAESKHETAEAHIERCRCTLESMSKEVSNKSSELQVAQSRLRALIIDREQMDAKVEKHSSVMQEFQSLRDFHHNAKADNNSIFQDLEVRHHREEREVESLRALSKREHTVSWNHANECIQLREEIVQERTKFAEVLEQHSKRRHSHDVVVQDAIRRSVASSGNDWQQQLATEEKEWKDLLEANVRKVDMLKARNSELSSQIETLTTATNRGSLRCRDLQQEAEDLRAELHEDNAKEGAAITEASENFDRELTLQTLSKLVTDEGDNEDDEEEEEEEEDEEEDEYHERVSRAPDIEEDEEEDEYHERVSRAPDIISF